MSLSRLPVRPRRPSLILPILLLTAGLLAVIPLTAEDCWIVREREPRAVIVPPASPSPSLAKAIGDLQSYIERMSSARVELRARPLPGQGALWLMTETDFDRRPYPFIPVASQPGVGRPDLGTLRSLNEEGFVIRTAGNQAWLVGRTGLGLQHAIYWLLEQWGCRWLFPGDAGEVVPAADRLAVTPAMETAHEPRFLMRDIWYNYGSDVPASAKTDLVDWKRRNRLDYSLTGTIGHAYRNIVPLKNDRLFREQPELFPLEDGRPVQKGQMAMGQPAVEERALRYAFDFFERSPSAKMVSMSPNDWFGPWRSEATRHDNFTDAAVDLANRTARALKENTRTRDKKVGFYAYLYTGFPPSMKVEDNVIVFVATRLNPLPWRWLVSLWSKKAENLGIRDYASILPWHGTRPTWGLTSLRRKVEFWDRNDIIGVNVESGNDWGGWGLYHYVLGRLLWNPREDVDRIFEDFTRKGFGEAAPQMGRYFKRWKLGYSNRALELATRDVAAALERDLSPRERRRIELYALYLHHLHLRERRLYAEQHGGDREPILREQVAFAWRLAPTSMAHSQALIEHFVAPQAKRQYRLSGTEFDSWKSGEPFTSGEARELLREDLKRSYE